MSNNSRGWIWVYNKARSYHVSRGTAFCRATRFMFTGDTGSFTTHGGFRKSRIKR